MRLQSVDAGCSVVCDESTPNALELIYVSSFVFRLTASSFDLRSADDLDAATVTARGGDAAGEMRRLEDALKRLRESFQEAKRLALGSEEAAAKCQVRTHAVPGSPCWGWV